MNVRHFVATFALVACSSKTTPTPPVELPHQTAGDLDVKVRVSDTKESTRMGQGWISHESIVMDVRRGKDYLPSPNLGCVPEDKRTFELRLDAARSLVAHRCKPSDAWRLDHIGATALHRDCEANGGTGTEPDLATAKTLLDRSSALAKCSVDEKLAQVTRTSAMLRLAVDVYRASKSEARTAEWQLVLLDALLAKNDTWWPRAVWDTEILQGVNNDSAALPPTVYPELQRQAAARLANAKTMLEIFSLVAVVDGKDPQLAKAAPSVMKVLMASPRTGLRDAATSLFLGSLMATDDARAAAFGCDALGAGMTNGITALAASRGTKECAAVKPALREHPNYSKAWMEVKCGPFDREAIKDAPKRSLDDKWKRKTLTDAAFNANPHELLIDWETGLLAASCPKK